MSRPARTDWLILKARPDVGQLCWTAPNTTMWSADDTAWTVTNDIEPVIVVKHLQRFVVAVLWRGRQVTVHWDRLMLQDDR